LTSRGLRHDASRANHRAGDVPDASSSSFGSKTILVLTAVPEYRARVIEELVTRLGDSVRVYAGREALDPTIKTEIGALPNVGLIRTTFLLRRRLIWQHVQFRKALIASVVLLQLNPRILTSWLILLGRRALGRRTVLWGHAFARKGPDTKTRWLRRAMRALADEVLVYTAAEAAQLKELTPGARVSVASNALYLKRELRPIDDETSRTGFIFVGRLVPSKKPELLVRAFIAAGSSLPRGCFLHIVGWGPLQSELESIARTEGYGEAIHFHGGVVAYPELRNLYGKALASVSPGYVGLSLTQSLGFGVPMIIARDEPHAPEIEAARPGFNSTFVASDDVDALSSTLVELQADRGAWLSRASAISADCAERYSVERMVDGFVAAIEGAE
jgi:glycosyltransferase involved in cell wall biosynthesis